VFVTVPTPEAGTVTYKRIPRGGDAPCGGPSSPGRDAEVVQVTVCPEMEQLPTLGFAETRVNPLGTVSVTVMVPVLASRPTLNTMITKGSVAPGTKTPEWLLTIVRSGPVACGNRTAQFRVKIIPSMRI
jgi:hypothetical protein